MADQTSSIEQLSSPTLEALCHDLDLFINELSVNNINNNNNNNSNNNRYSNNITPLELNKSINYDQEQEDESPGYSPVLESYTRYSEYNSVTINKSTSISSASSCNSEAKTQTTPPTSPSFLKVADKSEEPLYTTRSSSLNRTTSTRTVFNQNPTSPLAFEVVRETLEELQEFPNHSFLSYMADNLIKAILDLNEHRRIYCSAEYPLSFNGEELMDIIRSFSPPGLAESIYLEIAQCFLNSRPKLLKPIDSSEKSLRRNKVYDSPTEIYTLIEESLQEDIQGIYTPLTRCYSPSCLPGQPGCYSPFCPNRVDSLNGAIIRQPTKSLISSSSHDTTLSRAWSATVSKEILKSMPPDEIKRQEAIHEVIYTEDDYVRDLKILDVDFAKELLGSQCIEESRKQKFHDKIMNNYQEILDIHSALYQDLRDHQANCQATSGIGLVDQIGDIFMRHVPRFINAYLRYGPHVVLAEYEAKQEAERNMLFRHFIKAREALPQCRRLPFRHFIILPVTRLQRYSLLLGAVLKKTPDDNPDKQWIAQCIDEIKQVAERVDEGTSATKNTLRIMEINDRIRYKPDEYHNLQLLEPGRRLLKEGTMTRKSHMNVETSELHVFLFDHLLLMTRVKRIPNKDDVEYVVSKKPIPMQLLQIQDASEGFLIGLRNMPSTFQSNQDYNSNVTMSNIPSSSTAIVVSHLGRHGADYVLNADSPNARLDWKEKILQTKKMYEMTEISVFDIRTLNDTKFALSSSANNHGKVTCTVPFYGPRNIRMMAIGTQQGVWVGLEGDPNAMHMALMLSDVQQMAVLQDHYILLVLADKTLYAYALDPLLAPQPPNKKGSIAEKPSQKIAQHISYFHAGVCSGRTIVIAMKKKGVDSNFKVFEPICGDLRDPKNHKYFAKSGLFSKTHAWFKNFMEFYIGTESYAMHFLKARVVVVCARGFEIINLEALNMNRNLPDMNNPDFGFVQRQPDLKPLGMFRCGDNYMLCYNAFAFMVNIHGALVRSSPLIEWEGVPQAVAFYYPYVIGFDSRFIEVRNVETGALIQVLAGTNMRCLQNQKVDGIHGCMMHPFKPDYQCIFQLVGKILPST